MQSIKNTAVTIILLFLSYGVYQVLTKPLPSENQTGNFEPLEVSDPGEPGIPKDLLADMQLPARESSSDDIPAELLQTEPAIKLDTPFPPTAATQSDVTDEQLSGFASSDGFNPPSTPTYPIRQASSDQNLDSQFDSSNAIAPKNSNGLHQPPNQLRSDSQIIASTVMAPVATRPGSAHAEHRQSTPESKTLAQSWRDISVLIENGQFRESLQRLSSFYSTSNYSESEKPQLLDWLDALAAKVIYSSEHHLQSTPYTIQPGDTIGSLARSWQIPAQLIYNVNLQQIPDPNDLEPGVEIKSIQGPFNAEIDPKQRTLTLFLNGMYAGRFAIESGHSLQSGEYQIVDKSAQDHLDRPYWMALNNGGSIYASESNPEQSNEITLKLREAEEIFSILSATSKIKILR